MLLPFKTDTSTLKMRLTSVTMVNTSATVNWSQASGTTAYAKGTILPSITNSQISNGESLMLTEVEYDYTSPIGSPMANFLPGMSAYKDTFYHHPRNGNAVTCTSC